MATAIRSIPGVSVDMVVFISKGISSIVTATSATRTAYRPEVSQKVKDAYPVPFCAPLGKVGGIDLVVIAVCAWEVLECDISRRSAPGSPCYSIPTMGKIGEVRHCMREGVSYEFGWNGQLYMWRPLDVDRQPELLVDL